jgi:hypothetical protein
MKTGDGKQGKFKDSRDVKPETLWQKSPWGFWQPLDWQVRSKQRVQGTSSTPEEPILATLSGGKELHQHAGLLAFSMNLATA